jgi:hypothetical protein
MDAPDLRIDEVFLDAVEVFVWTALGRIGDHLDREAEARRLEPEAVGDGRNCTFPSQTRQAAQKGVRQAADMELPIPDFGDVVGLRRLNRAAVERVKQTDWAEADKRDWTAELTRQYRAATRAESAP